MADMRQLKSEARNIKGEAISKESQQETLWNDSVKMSRHADT